jgi:flagellum-specific peptidoglycan hydrolase FlgJ
MITTCWQSIVLIATLTGAKYPNLVSAQWALESGWGQEVSGVHNYFGQKGIGTLKMTKEWVDGQYLNVKDEFKDYKSPEASVEDLVNKWHKNYRGYKGVNNAKSREDAALMLGRQGYATSPTYSDKLINLMNRYSVPVPSVQPVNDKTNQSYKCS